MKISISFAWKMDRAMLGIGALMSKFQRPDPMLKVVATSAEHLIIPKARQILRANRSIFEGTLFRSIATRVSSSGGIPTVEVATIGVNYGKNIELGTPPSGPGPTVVPTKLVRWARIKLGARNPVFTARWISTKIQWKGSKAKPYLVPAYQAVKTAFWADVAARARKVVQS